MTEHRGLAAEADVIGQETLELFANTGKFNQWMFERLSAFCTDSVLEIGSGIGNISELLLKQFSQVSLSDIRSDYCQILQNKFGHLDHLKGVHLLDLSERHIEMVHPELQGKFSSVIASNVVEHIEDDSLAVQNGSWLLKSEGYLIVLVPSYGGLYNSLDVELGHFRRYNRRSVGRLFEKNGFRIINIEYFNAAAIFGWWLAGSVLRKKILPKNQLTLYNKLVPFMRLADVLLMRRCGLSVIAVGQKIK